MEDIGDPARRVVGFKQSLRALEARRGLSVYLAEDADTTMKDKVLGLSGETGTPVTWLPSMVELGKRCGIDVKAAVAVTLKPDTDG